MQTNGSIFRRGALGFTAAAHFTVAERKVLATSEEGWWECG